MPTSDNFCRSKTTSMLRKFWGSPGDVLQNFYRVLKGGGVQGEGVFLGNPDDSVWEDSGTLGHFRED